MYAELNLETGLSVSERTINFKDFLEDQNVFKTEKGVKKATLKF